MVRDMENKKYEKGALGWLKEQAKKDGFGNIRDWQNWKREKTNKRIRQGDFNQPWTKEKIFDLIRKTYDKENRIPVRSEFCDNHNHPSAGEIRKLFGGWNNVIIESGLWNKHQDNIGKCPRIRDGKTCGRLLTYGNRCEERDENGNKTGIWICHICYNRDSSQRPDSHNNALKLIADSRTGNLGSNCPKAKGDLGEELTSRWRSIKTLSKENDHYTLPFDHSRDPELGIIQTKTCWYDIEKRCWLIRWENELNKKFDNIIAHCISADGEMVENTYVIPYLEGITRKGIKIAGHGVKRRKPNRWYDKYLVDKQDMRNINEKWQEILKS